MVTANNNNDNHFDGEGDNNGQNSGARPEQRQHNTHTDREKGFVSRFNASDKETAKLLYRVKSQAHQVLRSGIMGLVFEGKTVSASFAYCGDGQALADVQKMERFTQANPKYCQLFSWELAAPGLKTERLREHFHDPIVCLTVVFSNDNGPSDALLETLTKTGTSLVEAGLASDEPGRVSFSLWLDALEHYHFLKDVVEYRQIIIMGSQPPEGKGMSIEAFDSIAKFGVEFPIATQVEGVRELLVRLAPFVEEMQ